MDPLERRIELIRAGVRPTDIARKAGVTSSSVYRVLDNLSTSDRLQRLIAKAIGKPVREVFPERYEKKALSPGLERLAG